MSFLSSRPSSRPLTRALSRKGFRVLAFALILVLLMFSYWLGNQFKRGGVVDSVPVQAGQHRPEALILEQPQAVPDVQVLANGAALPLAGLVDDWVFLLPGRLEPDLNRRLAQAWNQLALEPRIQSRMRVWLLDDTDVALPEFVRPLHMEQAQREEAGRFFVPGQLYLLNPKGQLRAIFQAGQSAASLAHDFEYILNLTSGTP